MIVIIIYSLVYIFFVITDLIPLFQEKLRKLFWTYLVLFILSYTLVFMVSFDIKIPSPAVSIKKAVSSILGLSE